MRHGGGIGTGVCSNPGRCFEPYGGRVSRNDEVIEEILDELACRKREVGRRAWRRRVPRSAAELAELRGLTSDAQRSPILPTTVRYQPLWALRAEIRRLRREHPESTHDWWRRLP
jgi:hypothetical protein